MSPAIFEDLIPGLREQRSTERHNRALAFAGLTRTVCGVEIVPLMPAHRLRLQLLRNAFTAPDVEAMAGDIFIFLWMLSPKNLLATRYSLLATFHQALLRRHVRRLDVAGARREIKETIAAQLQDTPETEFGGGGDEIGDSVHWMAGEAGFWLDVHGGFTLESYQHTPYLVLQQLLRAWRCNHPKILRNADGSVTVETPQFINPSDALIGRWHRARSAEIAEKIRNQRERLPN